MGGEAFMWMEAAASLPAGSEERFIGYGVMGLPFRSGHVLALHRSRRRFSATRNDFGWFRHQLLLAEGYGSVRKDVPPGFPTGSLRASSNSSLMLSPVRQ